jgi:two-component system, NtrC family, sensor kinase
LDAVADTMNPPGKKGRDDRDRLIDLAHLSSAVGHYLINAFSAGVSNAELIRSPESHSTERKEHTMLATSIIDTALDASQVARKLIDWARSAGCLELSEPDGEPRMVDLNQLIREVVEKERKSSDDQIEWRMSLGTICLIPGDPAQLGTMLGRFIENAREALSGGCGTIEFATLTDSRDSVIVTIHDSGCGMSQEVQRCATEPFFSTKPDHAGVGLTIAQVIWRRHRGGLSIESRPGLGTTIQLSIWPTPANPVRPQSEQGLQSLASPTA